MRPKIKKIKQILNSLALFVLLCVTNIPLFATLNQNDTWAYCKVDRSEASVFNLQTVTASF